MTYWRLLPKISAPMPFQMALDEVLFRNMEKAGPGAEKPLLRFYFSSEPWITTGYFETKSPDVHGVPACRRLTGGGRVLHGNDIIFSLIAGKKDHESFGSVSASYRKIHEAVKLALESAGKKPRFYQGREELPIGAECFAFPIESDLEVNGKKIAGGSQKRSSGLLLHQESIQLQKGMEAGLLISALCRAFADCFQLRLQDETLDPEDWAMAKKLSRNGYEPGRFESPELVLEKIL